MADATFTWNGGTGAAGDPTNWTQTGVANTPNIPQSDDDVVVANGDAQFTDMTLPGADNGTQGATVFLQGGTIDMINSGETAGILSNTLVQVTNSVAAVAMLTASGDSTNNGTIDVDANGTLVASFMAGTRIATERGQVAVEDLQVGDRVTTLVGGTVEPIVWIGHRTIDCTNHPSLKQVWPMRVAAGAFGRGKPSQDLWLSPDHAVYVEDVLIPVKHLINGSSITQIPRVSITYYHIELKRHDVILANGLAAGSYLADADRTLFANNAGPVALYPDFSSRVWEAEGCVPLVVTGPAYEAAQQRIQVPGRQAAQLPGAHAA